MSGANVPPNLTVSSNGIGVVPDALLNTFVQGSAVLANLRSFVGLSNMNVWMVGFETPNDGGQGVFYFNSSSTATDDGGVTIIQPNGLTTGRWLRQSAAVSGTLLGIQVLTGSGNFVPVPGTNKVILVGVGGGGGGGGGPVSNSGFSAAGGGASSGSYGAALFTSQFTSVPYVVGAGGAGVSGNTGDAGVATTFGASGNQLIVPGGNGGLNGVAVFTAGHINGINGGGLATVTGAVTLLVASDGTGGGPGMVFVAGTDQVGGQSGSGPWGGGRHGSGNGAGSNGNGPGAGGSGASSAGNGPFAGGNGAAGALLAYQYT
jgi:hypothetical protein